MKSILGVILVLTFSFSSAFAADKPAPVSKRKKSNNCVCADDIGAPEMCVPRSVCLPPHSYCKRDC